MNRIAKWNPVTASSATTITPQSDIKPFFSVWRHLSTPLDHGNGIIEVSFTNKRGTTFEPEINELGDELFHIAEHDQVKNIMIDLSELQYISAATVGKLIRADGTLQKKGGRLRIHSAQPNVYNVINICELQNRFPRFENFDQALSDIK